jgi:eukaryotic-like serine/threonine-protein kinase
MLAAVAGPSLGKMLGKYQVLRHLASGGMAEIYLARARGPERFERYVVVKCIKSEFAANAQFVEMFLDEARISAQLHHHHIAQVFDMGLENDVLYFAMEYLHGQNVQAILQAVSLVHSFVPLEHVLSIMIGAAQGLHYAHDKVDGDGEPLQLVHRDVTPTNIVVSYDGAVKVVDFGIAKAATRSTHTRSGVLKGKIAYLSPEQCHTQPLDRRSDVFALGILLYELATTHRLFFEESDYRTMDRIVNGDVPAPQLFRPDLPGELAAIMMRCLAVAPADRYQTADALVEDLLSFAQRSLLAPTNAGLARYMRELFGKPMEPWIGLAMPSEPPSVPALSSGVVIQPPHVIEPPRKRRAPVVIGGLAIVAVATAAAVWIGTRDPDLPQAPPQPIAAPQPPPTVVPEVPKPVGTAETATEQPKPDPPAPPTPTPPPRADRKPKPTTTVRKPPATDNGGSGSAKLRDSAILKPPD